MLSPHLGLLMPITNSVKAGKNAYKKPKTNSSILGSIYSLHRTQLRLEKLCIQLCHQNIYFVHDGFLLCELKIKSPALRVSLRTGGLFL